MFFPRNNVPALCSCHNSVFHGFMPVIYFPIFSIPKIVLNVAFDEKYESFCSSVCL